MISNLRAAISDSAVDGVLLSNSDANEFISSVEQAFDVNFSYGKIWDTSKAPRGVHSQDGWRLIPLYVGYNPCVLFFPEASLAAEFKSGSDLLLVLEQLPAYEFYVSNRDRQYLICFNDHDFVIGWGQAEVWVEDQGREDRDTHK